VIETGERVLNANVKAKKKKFIEENADEENEKRTSKA
jgi:hypothetical protein